MSGWTKLILTTFFPFNERITFAIQPFMTVQKVCRLSTIFDWIIYCCSKGSIMVQIVMFLLFCFCHVLRIYLTVLKFSAKLRWFISIHTWASQFMSLWLFFPIPWKLLNCIISNKSHVATENIIIWIHDVLLFVPNLLTAGSHKAMRWKILWNILKLWGCFQKAQIKQKMWYDFLV